MLFAYNKSRFSHGVAHIGYDVFKSFGWLPVSQRVDQIILKHVYKIKSGTSPVYMKEHFVPTSSVHSYSTRFRKNGCFSLPKVKSFEKKSFVYRGCILWNELPNYINWFSDLKLRLSLIFRFELDNILI